MPSPYSVPHIKSATLVGSAVDVVTFTRPYGSVHILNRGSAEIWARVDNIAPTVAGDNCFCVPGGFGLMIPFPGPQAGATGNAVQLISSGNTAYTATAV